MSEEHLTSFFKMLTSAKDGSYCCLGGGRLAPEWVAGFVRNRWPEWFGIHIIGTPAPTRTGDLRIRSPSHISYWALPGC